MIKRRKRFGGEYQETTFKRRNADPIEVLPSADGVHLLDEEQWNDVLGTLDRAIAGKQLRSDRPPRELEETSDAFRIRTVLSRGESEIALATATWPKRTFDSWWESQGAKFVPHGLSDDAATAYTLPSLDVSPCANDTWTPTRQDVPDARMYHTGVWTGAEMIVWGGGVNMPPVSSGGRYDPATDTWNMTSIGTDVPEWRTNHAAVWTGTEMIVWV